MDDQIFDNLTRSELPLNSQTPQPRWRAWLRAKAVWIAGVTAVLLVGGIFWYFLSAHPTVIVPQSNNVLLIMKGPSQITSDNEAEYTIIYRNGENADLVNLSMEVFYPSGFKFKSATPVPTATGGSSFTLPAVSAGRDGQVVIRGKLSGSTGEDKEIKARLHYKLSNFNSQFVVEQSIHTSILPPDLVMDISGPVDVVNGQDSILTVNLTNVTAQDFTNLAVQLTYPTGFVFTSALPAASTGNNYWKLPKLASNTSASLTITGSFTGDDNSEHLVRADLGQIINNNFAPQITNTATFRIIPSALKITLTADQTDFVRLGDTINYKLSYVNQGTIGLNNLIITVNLDSSQLDYSRLNAPDGIITNHTITWKAGSLATLNVLSPNETGQLTFSIPVKQTFTSNLKNQTITAVASIASQEINKPTKTPDLQLKIISALDLQVQGDYISGSVPMRVGQTTIFQITFLLTNLSNDSSNTQVIASMPLPSSSWSDIVAHVSGANDVLAFDPNSGKIRWTLGTVSAFTGKFSPAAKVTFQLQVTPAATDQGKSIILLKDVQATGADAFVNQPLQTENIPTVDTGNINDDTLNSKGNTVQ